MRDRLLSLLVALSLLGLTLPGLGQDDEAPKKGKKKDGVRPYDDVIPAAAKSDPGLFLVHRVEDDVFYEIPRPKLDQPLLWVTQIARTQAGHGYGGTAVGNRVVRWELRDETVLLRDVKFRIRAEDGDAAVRQAVAATSLEPIIASFPVKAWGKDQAPVIEVGSLFLDDLPEFSAARRLDASGVDRKRSFFESAKSFPTNIETDVLMTYKLKAPSAGGGGPGPRGRNSERDPSQGAVSVVLHHSMVELPPEPMTPRRHDDRVGFFSVSFDDFGDAEDHAVESVRYVTRWRLEKKDPSAAVSEPVKPIVFYVGRGVPEKWRPWVKKGIEAWQPAFAAAGFAKAIVAMDPPSAREDADWDAEDARYSTIRWMPSTVENAMGPHVHDPRTGEILEADIIMYHNVLKLVRDWYFVQASPNDARAQTLPLPDDLMGELLAYVVAHEVGHSLGFPHNMKASSSYTVEQLRDPEFTRVNGTEASIMDYGRFNYVAQPGDGARLIPVVGPYDFFAVKWGYGSFETPAAEEQGLAALVARQKSDRTLRFGGANANEDPSQQTEDLGDDAIRATELGLANLDRVAAYLVGATCREGKNYDLLSNMYDRLVGQRNRELMHVAAVVGGVERTNLWYGDRDRVFDPIAKARQAAAVAFLNRHAFEVPAALVDANITSRLEASGAADRILSGQKRILSSLMAKDRIDRMAELAAKNPADAYAPSELLAAIRSGIWSELQQDAVAVDLYRRNLQRAHSEALIGVLGDQAAGSDLPALCRGELEAIVALIRTVFGQDRPADPMTRLHLKDQEVRIVDALDTKGRSPADRVGNP